MKKIERLEKRINELETFIRLMKWNNDNHNKDVRIWRKIIPDNKGFEENFIQKYSIKEYRKRGFSEEYDQLDFKTAVEKMQKLGDGSKKLHFWMNFHRKLIDTIGLDQYALSDYWGELIWFIRQSIEYYQNKIIERILKEGKHFEGSGRTPISKKNVINLWNKFSKMPEYIWTEFENKRYAGCPKKEDIYELIADELDIPMQENRTRTIQKIITAYLK
ncbi:MAG: hypothetical protein JJU13_07405 [Balneolaceae bacterium]|nr:hypothetical protein [Balneolaceae bacterium]